MRVLLLIVWLSAFSLPAWAEEIVTPQVLFERAVSEAEKKQFALKDLTHFSKDDIGAMRDLFRERKWGREVVKVELLRVSKNATPELAKLPGYSSAKENTPLIHITYLGEILYSGKINEETQNKHLLRVNRLEVDRSAILDEVRKEYSKKKWGPKIISVEMLYGGMDVLPPYIRPYLQVTQLGDDKQYLAELETAKAALKKTYAIGKDVAGYKYRGCAVTTGVLETFEHADKRKVEVAQVEIGADREHEFIRQFMDFDCDIVGMKFGNVVRSTVPVPLGDGKTRVQTRLGWLSETNVFIVVNAVRVEESDPCKEFHELLGEKFPSSLNADFKIDKTLWARVEVGLQLRRMGEALKGSRDDFIDCYGALSKVARLPAWLSFKNDYDLNFQQRVLGELNEWWAAHQEKCVWDRTLQRLVQR